MCPKLNRKYKKLNNKVKCCETLSETYQLTESNKLSDLDSKFNQLSLELQNQIDLIKIELTKCSTPCEQSPHDSEELQCVVEKILNTSLSQQTDKEQFWLMVKSQVENLIDSKFNCLIKSRLKLYSGSCFIKLPGFDVNNMHGVYQCILDRIYISATMDLDININSASDTITICFVSGEQFQPIYASVSGLIGLQTQQGNVYTGFIHSNNNTFSYCLDQSLVGLKSRCKIGLSLQYRINNL